MRIRLKGKSRGFVLINGLELCFDIFSDHCKKMGITKHKSVARTPQQNGLAKRFNRSMLERVRCMFSSAAVPKTFWVEAVTTTCFFINRCQYTALNMKTPKEVWSGHPPTNDRLRVFGCVAYARIRQDKLEPRALKCMFIGYPEAVKGYKLWCLEDGHKKKRKKENEDDDLIN